MESYFTTLGSPFLRFILLFDIINRNKIQARVLRLGLGLGLGLEDEVYRLKGDLCFLCFRDINVYCGCCYVKATLTLP